VAGAKAGGEAHPRSATSSARWRSASRPLKSQGVQSWPRRLPGLDHGSVRGHPGAADRLAAHSRPVRGGRRTAWKGSDAGPAPSPGCSPAWSGQVQQIRIRDSYW